MPAASTESPVIAKDSIPREAVHPHVLCLAHQQKSQRKSVQENKTELSHLQKWWLQPLRAQGDLIKE